MIHAFGIKKWITKNNGMDTEEPTADILHLQNPTIESAG